MSEEERGVFELMFALLSKHVKSLPKLDWKLILKWVAVKCPGVTPSPIFTAAVWDDVGVKLYGLATMGHELAMSMLVSWSVIFETLKKQEKSQAVSSAILPAPCPALTLPAHFRLAPLILKSGCSHQPPLCPVKGGEGILSRIH